MLASRGLSRQQLQRNTFHLALYCWEYDATDVRDRIRYTQYMQIRT